MLRLAWQYMKGVIVTMHKPDPDFDRLRQTLLCEEPDRVPTAELYIDRPAKEGFLGESVDTLEKSILFYYAAGYDFYGLRFSYVDDFQVGDFSKSGRGDATFTKSAYGEEKKRERHWVKGKEHYISTIEDFESFDWPDPETEKVAGEADIENVPVAEALDRAHRALPEGMKVIAWTSGIFEYVSWLMGFETFCEALIANPDLIQKMFEKVGSLFVGLFKYMAQLDIVGALWYADDVAYGAGLLWSPEFMRKYMFPWYEEIGSIAKRYDLPLILHSDGDLTKILDDYVALGWSAIQPIEPNAMDIRVVKKKYAGKLALIGNVDLGYTLTRGTPAEVKEEVKGLIRDLAPGGGYVLGSSNTITDYVPPENYRALLDATFEYGKYPIKLS